MFLVKMNFVAFMTALNSLEGSERLRIRLRISSLPENSSGSLYHIIFRRANIVEPGDRRPFPTLPLTPTAAERALPHPALSEGSAIFVSRASRNTT